MSAFAARAPLSASQQDALRHLELAVARASTFEESDAVEDYDCRSTSGSCGLVAHSEGNPDGAVRSAAELEAFSRRAELALRERSHAVNHSHLKRLVDQRACCADIVAQSDKLHARLEGKAAECAALRTDTSEMLSQLGVQMRSLREQAALNEALQAQLAPLEEAKAIGAILDKHSWRDDTPHTPEHPLVVALGTLDASVGHLQAHAHWANSAVHLAQVRSLRARTLRLVASLALRPLDAMTTSVAAELAQQPAAGGEGAVETGSAADCTAVHAASSSTAASGTNLPEVRKAVEGAAPVAAREALETEVLYLRYRELAGRVMCWIGELEARIGDGPEVVTILLETQVAYWRARRVAVSEPVRSALKRIAAEGEALSSEIRACTAHVLRLCRAEHSLYRAFFSADLTERVVNGAASSLTSIAPSSTAQSPLMADSGAPRYSQATGSLAEQLVSVTAEVEGVCYGLYDHLRPRLLRQHQIAPLCEAVLIFRTETLPALAEGGAATAALTPIVERLLQDAQERLIFRVQTFVRDEIRAFRPSAAQIAFPRPATPALQRAAPAAAPPGGAAPTGAPLEAAFPSTPARGSPSHSEDHEVQSTPATVGQQPGGLPDDDTGPKDAAAVAVPPPPAQSPAASTGLAVGADAQRGGGSLEDGWYTTVDRALSCLAQLYRCVPRAVFEGLAQEVLTECAASIERAATLLRAQHAASKPVARLHGWLFTISQLLVLREQIAPFETDFAVTDKTLDFTQARQAVRRLVERRGRVGGLGGVVELLQQGVPSIVRTERDAKAALDRDLRTTCEAFIGHCTTAAATPISGVLAALSPPVAAQAEPAASEGGTPLKSKPHVSSDAAVGAAVAATEKAVEGELRTACSLMAAYLPEASTRAILFAPIRSTILEALGELQTLINAIELSTPGKCLVEPGRLSRLAGAIDALGGADPND